VHEKDTNGHRHRSIRRHSSGVDGIAYPDKAEGPISAAILAAGIGALALGVVTTLAEASSSIKTALQSSWVPSPRSSRPSGSHHERATG